MDKNILLAACIGNIKGSRSLSISQASMCDNKVAKEAWLESAELDHNLIKEYNLIECKGCENCGDDDTEDGEVCDICLEEARERMADENINANYIYS
jgi:multimeric flavodoxin WrbA